MTASVSSGVWGSTLNTKMTAGKNARNKRNEIAAARVATAPSINPTKKNRNTSYTFIPSWPQGCKFRRPACNRCMNRRRANHAKNGPSGKLMEPGLDAFLRTNPSFSRCASTIPWIQNPHLHPRKHASWSNQCHQKLPTAASPRHAEPLCSLLQG